ncbi:unnamed protein product, partial [marine sediment metagenome]
KKIKSYLKKMKKRERNLFFMLAFTLVLVVLYFIVNIEFAGKLFRGSSSEMKNLFPEMETTGMVYFSANALAVSIGTKKINIIYIFEKKPFRSARAEYLTYV